MKDLTGIQIGRLTVLEYAGRNKKNEPMWLCQCSCGNKKEIKGYSLTCKKPTQSCGCIQHEILVKRNKENGIRNGDTENPLYGRIYRIWCAMKHRCEKENDVNYHLYGGRGITVCKEWHDWETFKNWALNNGYQDDLSIDRIDTDGNYEPSNCRWATNVEQGNNKRNNKLIPYKGRIQSLKMWTDELNLDYHRTKARLNACNYTPEQAFELEKYAAQKQFENKALGQHPPQILPA